MRYNMNDKLRKQSIQRLSEVPEQVLTTLENNNIATLGELCCKTTTDLKDFGIENKSIRTINTELQLLGLGLKNSL